MNPLVAPEQIVRPHRCALSVNVNKVAHLRNTRHLGIPSVARAATLCLQAGAQGITVHPRPDERHIRAGDVADEINGNLVTYDSVSEVMNVTGGSPATSANPGGRVRVVLTPREGTEAAAEAAKKALNKN